MSKVSATICWPTAGTDPLKFTDYTAYSLIQHLRQISENEVFRAEAHKGKRIRFEVEVWSDE